MKLTKKQESDVWKVYNTWLESYIHGNVATYGKYLDKDYHLIGATHYEEYLNKKETINFFQLNAEHLHGRSQLRNEIKDIEKFEELIFITHLFDAWYLNETEWNYDRRFRLTNVLKKQKEEWRFIYQHLSTTDLKAKSRKAVDLEEIRAENLQLRGDIQCRKLELEHKNRELEIEGALERIRAQAVAMKTSSDLLDIVVTMRNEFIKLGQEAHYFWHMMWLKDNYEKAMTSGDGTKIGMIMKLPRLMHGEIPVLAKWEKSKKPIIVYPMDAETAVDYVDKMIRLGDFQQVDPQAPSLDDVRHIGGLTFIMARTTHGEIGFSLPGVVKNPPVEALKLLEQFAGAFDLVHRRFLDLQKAEAQAREAQINLAVERVRAKALAMHKSEEIMEVVAKLKDEVMGLDIPGVIAASIFLEAGNDNIRMWDLSSLERSDKGYLAITDITFKLKKVDPHLYINRVWENTENYFVDIQDSQDLDRIIEFMYENTPLEVAKEVEDYTRSTNLQHLYHAAKRLNNGKLCIDLLEPPSDEMESILNKIGAAFDLAYQRFLDLQKAEAQTREAQIETALEKVRSRTLAMQKSDELADTSIVIFEQLINLGIEPNRLFIGIIKEETHSIEAWATNEDGTKIDNHFTLNTDNNISVKKMYEDWKNKKTSTTIDMQGEELQDYFHYLSDEMKIPFQGGLSQKRRVQTIAYFGQGLIGMASPDGQPISTTQLLERFAAVFNLTFTRFNDLKIAEAHAIQAEKDLILLQTEKKKAEEALSELQLTQKQLIQSEKMASLGELTAGIAHEIQNPLNFVNNFSEVSQELIDELKEELELGHMDGVKDILNDVIHNLQKINHHGKRADGIVKGMLQHSRKSSVVKEATDINELCDEILRLSYHGLRAKDKSFNATYVTDFDKNLPKANVFPQELGRVILNLLTNAFYAVKEKDKLNKEGFEPTVSIGTKLYKGGIKIKVSDNGNGISKNVLDKIYQPFFTTKPTGEGTGLGLSMSYDIITKSHGGSLKVVTKAGKGTDFIIELPRTSIVKII